MDPRPVKDSILIGMLTEGMVWRLRLNARAKLILTNLGHSAEYPLDEVVAELNRRLKLASDFLRKKAAKASVTLPDNYEAVFDHPESLLDFYAHCQGYTFIFLSVVKPVDDVSPILFRAHYDATTNLYRFNAKGGVLLDHPNKIVYIGYPTA